MTPEAAAAVIFALQWGLLVAYTVVALAALIDGCRPAARRMAVAVAFIAIPHAVYYALFLIWPDVLGPIGTMLFSIGLRYQPLGIAVLLLLLVRRGQLWKR